MTPLTGHTAVCHCQRHSLLSLRNSSSVGGDGRGAAAEEGCIFQGMYCEDKQQVQGMDLVGPLLLSPSPTEGQEPSPRCPHPRSCQTLSITREQGPGTTAGLQELQTERQLTFFLI